VSVPPVPSAALDPAVTGTDPGPPAAVPRDRGRRVAWVAVVVILVGVIVLVTYALTRKTTPAAVTPQPPSSPAIVAQMAKVPADTFDDVGVSSPGFALTPPTVLHGQPKLTADGKPEVLWVGSEFCPFCAAERWPLIVALSRFGRFTTLYNTVSSANSVFPGIQSFSFDDATYSSRYLTFTGVELFSNTLTAGGSYQRIARLAPGQAALVARYGATQPGGASPFVDIADRMTATTAAFSPAALVHLSQGAIAGDLAHAAGPPADPTGEAVVAAANQLTAGLCAATGQRPRSVCSSRGVRTAASALGMS
jgi:hypothetical protein